MNGTPPTSRRFAPIAIAVAVLFACAACSAGPSGSGSTGATGGTGDKTSTTSASNFGNTGGSVKAECNDFANNAGASGDTPADRKKFAAYWEAMAKDAPADIKDATAAIAQAADKIVAGDVSAATQKGITDNIGKIADWAVANCKA